MQKRVLNVVLSVLLIATFLSSCATGSKPPANSSSPDASIQISPSESPQSSSNIQSSPSETADTDASVARGTWDNNVFSSNLTNLSFNLPKDWLIVSDDDFAKLMGVAADTLKDKSKSLIESAKLTTIYDMMAKDPFSNNNVIVMYENLSMSASSTITEDQYLKVIEKQITANSNLNYSFDEPFTVLLGNISYLAVKADEASHELSQYYLMHKEDKYMVIVIITITDKTKIDDILGQFK